MCERWNKKLHEAEHILELVVASLAGCLTIVKMAEYFTWHMIGRRRQHKQTVAQETRLIRAPVTQSSLAALPSEILACVFRHLYKSPEAAISLAQTCQTLASEFWAHRSEVIGHRATSTGLCPVYDIPDLKRNTRCFADIDIWWSRESTMRQICTLSEQPGGDREDVGRYVLPYTRTPAQERASL